MVEINREDTGRAPPAREGGVLKLKIAKKAYVFDVRKKYSVSRNFLMKKKAETPTDDIKAFLSGIFSRKKLPQASAGGKLPAASVPSPPSSSPTGTLVKSMGIAALIMLLAGAAFVGFFMLGGKPVAPPQGRPNSFGGSYNFSVHSSEVVSVLDKDSTSRIAYFLIEYSSANLTSLNISVRVLGARPTTQVFLLDYAREGADAYATFRKTLMDNVRAAGIAINEIDIERLGSVPAGATVVVPSGNMPEELIGIGSAYDFKTILSHGVNIVYIGLPFDRSVLDKDGNPVQVNYNKISFSENPKITSTEGFGLFQPDYLATPNEDDLTNAGQLYGSISVIRLGQGTMLLLPQTIDGGWRGDGDAAGKDVARLIREERWLSPLASVNLTVNTSLAHPSAGMLELPGNGTGATTISVFTTAFASDSAFGEVILTAMDGAGNYRRSISTLRLDKTQLGEMYPKDPQTVPYYLSGQKTRLTVELREPVPPGEPAPAAVKLSVRLFKDGSLLQEEELELGKTVPGPDNRKFKDMQINAEPGKYVVRVEDAAKKNYAATALEVVGLDVEANKSLWQTGKFNFFLSAGGQPVTPRQIAVSLDGKGEKRYYPASFTYAEGKTVLNYEYIGEIKPGNHSFIFTAGNWTRVLSANYAATRNFWDNPLVLLLAGLSVVVVGIGAMLRRPEQMRYGLDIPDFPPMSTTKIPVKRQAVLEVFENVNAGYSWQWMPLRIDELKAGFRRLTYNGKPILIGDFNLERILAKLQDERLVKEELGYFGLSSWENDSGHSTAYLTMYRIMRNVFVNNAVKFSRLGAMKDCDLKAIAGKEEIYLHIMEKPYEDAVHRALATSKLGTTIMVFKTEEERDDFRSSLTSTSKLAVALKMEVNNGNIFLFPVKNAISAYLKGVVK